MKKSLLVLFILQVFFISCTATKPLVTDNDIFQDHQPPFKIFSIGNWKPGYCVLTLTDAKHQYITIKALQNDSLKIGDEYHP